MADILPLLAGHHHGERVDLEARCSPGAQRREATHSIRTTLKVPPAAVELPQVDQLVVYEFEDFVSAELFEACGRAST